MINKINIELNYLDALTKKTLAYFFQSNLCKNAILSKTPDITNLYIVDYLNIKGSHFLQQTLNNNKFVIILHNNSDQIEPHDKILLLEKPIGTAKLVELIDRAHKETFYNKTTNNENQKENQTDRKILNDSQHTHLYNAVHEENKYDIHQRFKAQKHVGSNKDISENNKLPENRFLTKNKYLYHYLKTSTKLANTNKSNTVLKTFYGDILYNFKNKQFTHELDTNKLKFIQKSTLSEDIIITFTNDNLENISEGGRRINEAEFIWESAIQASKGRIPKTTNPNNPVILKAWPNFSKLLIFRYAIQITAVWSQHKISLLETAKQLKIPQRYVFTLYCAMHALNYAETDNIRENSTLKTSNESSLFSKILNHIFG